MKRSFENHISTLTYLSQIAAHLPASVNAARSAQQLVLDPYDLYIVADISGAGSGETTILDEQTDKLIGVSSYDTGGKLSGNKVAIFDKAVVLCASTAQAGDDVRALSFTATMPKEVANSEIVVYQRNQEVLRAPMQSLNGKVGSSANLDVFRELFSPRFLVPGAEIITIKIEVPKTVAIPAGTYIKFVIPALLTRNI